MFNHSNPTNIVFRNLTTTLFNQERLILLNFALLLVYAMFGTGPRWESREMQSYYEESTNPINQFIFIFLLISAVLAAFNKTSQIISFIKKEKFVTIFVVFCLLSALWSDYSLISIKRSFQLFVTVLVILMAVLFIEYEQLLKIVKFIIAAYLIGTIVSVLLIPEAIDPKFNTWRGLEPQKNGTGQAAIICFLFTLLFFGTEKNALQKYWYTFLTALSILIIIMAQSSTIIIILFTVLLISLILKLESIFSKLAIRRFFVVSLFFIGSLFVVILLIYSTEVFASITTLFEKDLTFTGRTIFWGFLIQEVLDNALLGFGYGTYWVMGSEHVYRLFIMESLVMNSSHNGFIDLSLQLGFTGLFLFLLIVAAFFNRSLKLHNNIMILALLAILLSNLTETTFLGTRNMTFAFFYFYLMVSKLYYSEVKTIHLYNSQNIN